MRTRLGDFFDFSSIDCSNFSTQAEKSVPVEQERILAQEEPSDLTQTTHGEGKGADAPGNGSTTKICFDTEVVKEFLKIVKEETPSLDVPQKKKGRLSWAIPVLHLELELSHQLSIIGYLDDASFFLESSWAGASLIQPIPFKYYVGVGLTIFENQLDYPISLRKTVHHPKLELSHQLSIIDILDDASLFPKGSWAGANLIQPIQCECSVGGGLPIPEYYLDYPISLCKADFLSVKLSTYQICDERLRLNLSKLPIRFLLPKPDT